MASDGLAFASILEQGRLLRGKQVSSVELALEYLDRIDRENDALRAFITVCRPAALAAARAAEIELGRGEDKGLLHGIPVALKDQMRIAGVRTTGGSRLFKDFVPQDDATIVTNLRRAGAVLLGTLNTSEFHMGGATRDWPYGTPRNPWDTTRTPGASSSGPAAAVAAGLCSGAVGEDTGGSIRGPAAYCGVTGLKPTWSRISRHGVFPLAWPMDCAGPMARTAADCAVMLEHIAGRDHRDATSSSEVVPRYLDEISGDIRGLRVGIVEEMLDESIDKEIRHGVERAIDVLSGLGAEVARTSLPLVAFGKAVHTAVVDPEAASYHRERLLHRYLDFEWNTRVRLMVGAVLPGAMHTLATRVRAAIARQLVGAFERFDVLVGSTTASVAGLIQTEPPMTSTEDALRLFGREGEGTVTTAFSMSGVPAISVPCGFSADGMPFGLHVAARHFQEGRVLRVAHAYQQSTEWHLKHPPAAAR